MSNKLRYLCPVASYSSSLCLQLAIYHFKSELQLKFLKLSIPFRVTAFKFVTCDSFQVCYVQQLLIRLCATAFKFATSNSFRVIFQCMNHSLIISVLTQVVLPPHKFVHSLYILSQRDDAHSIYFTNDPLILLNDSPGLHLPTKDHITYVIDPFILLTNLHTTPYSVFQKVNENNSNGNAFEGETQNENFPLG